MAVNWTEAEAKGADVKNGWSYSSTPPYCLHNLRRDHFKCPSYVIGRSVSGGKEPFLLLQVKCGLLVQVITTSANFIRAATDKVMSYFLVHVSRF